MSEFEKLEQERKKRAEKQQYTKSKQANEENNGEDDRSERKEKEIDYNALDYEDNQTDEETDIPRKQVPSLVQYPLINQQNFAKNQTENDDRNNGEERNDENTALNKRSEVLAMALGVQIKNDDEPAGENNKISGFDKKQNNRDAGNLSERLYKLAGQENAEKVIDDRRGRNKFETEKPLSDSRNNYRGNEDNRRRPVDRRRYDRRPVRRPPFRRPHYDRRERDRRVPHRSRRSRSPRERRRSHSRRRTRSRSSSVEKKRSKTRSKTPELPVRERTVSPPVINNEKERGKEPAKVMDSETEEKYKKLLLLRKKMELLELKKKKEEEQVCIFC